MCPLIWYYAAILYLRKYYDKDPRERDGLAAAACAVSLPLRLSCNCWLATQSLNSNATTRGIEHLSSTGQLDFFIVMNYYGKNFT